MCKDRLGIVEWFHPARAGEFERALRLADRLQEIGIRRLRLDISWAEVEYEKWKGISPSFYDRLLPFLAARFELLPNLMYTPPSLGVVESPAAPPRDPGRFAYFVREACERWGAHFDYVELWNEPNSRPYWRHDLDPERAIFRAMLSAAIPEVHRAGKKAVLGGPSPFDMRWFCNMEQDKILSSVDVLGVHGFPGTFDGVDRPHFPWKGWDAHIGELRSLLAAIDARPRIWITEVGASDRLSVGEQQRVLDAALAADVDRVYWYSAMDFAGMTLNLLTEGVENPDDFRMGLFTRALEPKPLVPYLAQRARE